LGETDSWRKKNLKSKISWHCPFKDMDDRKRGPWVNLTWTTQNKAFCQCTVRSTASAKEIRNNFSRSPPDHAKVLDPTGSGSSRIRNTVLCLGPDLLKLALKAC
jgi:hypothetical protein